MQKVSKINFINILTIIVVVGCFAFFFWICIPAKQAVNENHNIGEVKTALISALFTVLTFHFGSSKNSRDKDETIKNLQATPTKAETVKTDNIEVVNANSVEENK